jgi:hypothetical protein
MEFSRVGIGVGGDGVKILAVIIRAGIVPAVDAADDAFRPARRINCLSSGTAFLGRNGWLFGMTNDIAGILSMH